MTAIAARLVRTPNSPLPYKIVVEHDDMTVTEQPCASCREGEDAIRAALTPCAPPLQAAWRPPLICGAPEETARVGSHLWIVASPAQRA